MYARIVVVLFTFLLFASVRCLPVEEAHDGFNASHAVARGIVERSSDYYCQTHCAQLCNYHSSGWCCGVDDCHHGSHHCKCYNICYCGSSGYAYRCHHCDVL